MDNLLTPLIVAASLKDYNLGTDGKPKNTGLISEQVK
jgi:hypothetical protein